MSINHATKYEYVKYIYIYYRIFVLLQLSQINFDVEADILTFIFLSQPSPSIKTSFVPMKLPFRALKLDDGRRGTAGKYLAVKSDGSLYLRELDKIEHSHLESIFVVSQK